MILIFILSIICDIAFYMVFANIFSQALFEGGITTLVPLLIMAATAFCAYLLHKIRPWLRFLPIILLVPLPVFFYWKQNLASAVLLLLPCAYVALTIFLKNFAYNADQLSGKIKFCTIVIFLPLIMTLFMGDGYLSSIYYFHYVFIYIGCAICALRIARTDEKPLSDPKFIMINIIPVIGSLAALFILGSPWVLAILWHGVEFIYKSIIMPAMKFGIYILSLIIPTIAYTGDTLEYYSIENRVDLAEYESLTAGTQTNHVVLAILLIAIAIFIGINLLRKYRHHKYASQGILEIRSTIKPMVEEPRSASKQSLFTPRDPRLAVRHHYRQFLKMCAEKGCPPEKGDTSKDINAKNKTKFSEESITRLRELYIKARYSEHVIEIRDSKEAAGLVKQL